MLFGEKKNPKDIEKSSPRLVIMNNDGTCNQMIKFFFNKLGCHNFVVRTSYRQNCDSSSSKLYDFINMNKDKITAILEPVNKMGCHTVVKLDRANNNRAIHTENLFERAHYF